jgi:competence protein ComEC
VVIARLPSYLRLRASFLAATACVLLAGWQLVPTTSPPPPRGLRVTFLDVGQGDAVLLQVREGAVLVDQGPPEGEVARQLRDLGVRRLAALVLTHPQRDHIGGAGDVLRSAHVDLVLDPRIPADSPHHDDAVEAARDRRVRLDVAAAGQQYDLGRLRLRLLWPRQPVPAGRDPNDDATVIVASYGETDIVLTADAESNVTLPLRLPPAEVLKVAHHGSADEGLPTLLERVRPQVAVISVGRNNDYGHPAPSTVTALADARGLSVYRTDLDGRVTIESDGRRLTVRAARCSRLCPWRT